ncbi:flap endonuclease [Rhodococcus hoagii]|jgi:5'-3' exonuclease|uniref:5'-3' exonuclease n=2 Tax=Rhodococcus hoagii TaxID=43767 RepID=A0AAE2W7K5_RHOHA|nr:5'-3' exonuclease [Prescottella equi]MBM4484699.1 flap endonuclease [Prescottella equi]MBM4493573.1 flap endonuclease [Prescottella equi]MBM4536813.1 flap endonuclease [Prescottella equi]MBM4540707.1 flap endonuclease [Prescottella equi]MBM4715311.1 flap endonuclease [Prescottella equi]
MSGPLLLLDGASLWFRAFYALPESMTAPDGRPVNAVRGFTDMVAALITRTQPSRLAVCLDLDWRPQFRVDAVPSYKAHRVAEGSDGSAEEVPDTLTPQVDMIMDVLDAAGIATAGAAGLEADDVLGTLAAQEKTDTVVVVSGDRDLLQVVADDPVAVRVLYVGRGLAKAELFGPEEVAAKYGVPADRAGAAYAELALLRGDSSDGLPGVKGVGEKTASTLLLRHGSLRDLRAAAADPAGDVAKGIRAKLDAAADYLDAALPVVRVVTDADVRLSRPDVLPGVPADSARLDKVAAELGIERSVARLLTAMATERS